MASERTASRRALLATLAAAGGMSTTACFGSFNLTRVLYNWNDSFGNKFIKWLMFLVLVILPIYGIAMFVDAIVLNSIEFWTGSNPVSAKKLPDGYRVASSQTEDPNVVRHELYKHEQQVAVLFLEKRGDNQIRVLDHKRRVLTQVRLNADRLELQNERQETIAALTPEDCRQIKDAYQSGQPVAEAMFDRLTDTNQIRHVSEAAAAIQGRVLL